MYMCWHGGLGHGYPQSVMDAAGRLRERHMPQVGSNEGYTALTFPVSPQDVRDRVRALGGGSGRKAALRT